MPGHGYGLSCWIEEIHCNTCATFTSHVKCIFHGCLNLECWSCSVPLDFTRDVVECYNSNNSYEPVLLCAYHFWLHNLLPDIYAAARWRCFRFSQFVFSVQILERMSLYQIFHSEWRRFDLSMHSPLNGSLFACLAVASNQLPGELLEGLRLLSTHSKSLGFDPLDIEVLAAFFQLNLADEIAVSQFWWNRNYDPILHLASCYLGRLLKRKVELIVWKTEDGFLVHSATYNSTESNQNCSTTFYVNLLQTNPVAALFSLLQTHTTRQNSLGKNAGRSKRKIANVQSFEDLPKSLRDYLKDKRTSSRRSELPCRSSELASTGSELGGELV